MSSSLGDRAVTLLVRHDHTVTVACADTSELLDAVECKFGVPRWATWLCFAGKKLEAGMPLSHYGLCDGSTVHVATRGFGGGCGNSKGSVQPGGPSTSGGLGTPQGKQAQTTRSEDAGDMRKYTGLSSLRAFLGGGDVAFIRASHLLSLASTEGAFFRRQDLPEGAIVDRAMLERSFAELDAWDAYLSNGSTDPQTASFHSQFMRFPPFVIISYAWSAREHPDAAGRQLREVIAPAIEWYMAERLKLIKEGGFANAPRIDNAFDADGCDFCVFLDYSSLYQHSADAHSCDECKRLMESNAGPCECHHRTPEQDASFKRALDSMELLYAHSRTCVWRLTRLLDGLTCAPYDDRGWPFFETTVSWLIKLAPNCLDLGTEAARRALAQFEGRMRPVEELVAKASYTHFKEEGVHGELKDARSPPVLPDDFAVEMRKKKLTNNKDSGVVTDLQRKVTEIVLNGVDKLDFSSLGWDGRAGQQLAKVLPWCSRLCTLNVSDNKFGVEGAKAIGEALKLNTTITSLKCAAARAIPHCQ